MHVSVEKEGWGSQFIGRGLNSPTTSTCCTVQHHYSTKLQARRVRALTRRLACYLVALLLLVAGFSTFLAVPAAQYVVGLVFFGGGGGVINLNLCFVGCICIARIIIYVLIFYSPTHTSTHTYLYAAASSSSSS